MDAIGVNTKSNLLQFSNEPNMFYVLMPKKWEHVSTIDFNNKVEVEPVKEELKKEVLETKKVESVKKSPQIWN